MATVPTTLIEPIRVANLPLPPDLAAMLDRDWRSRGYTARERACLEEDVKLRHHYAGHSIVATADSPGLLIHAIDLENPDEAPELRERLRAQGYRLIYGLYPTPLAEPTSLIITLNSDS